MDRLFRKTIIDRLSAAQQAAGSEPAKVTCMFGNEARVVEVMSYSPDTDCLLLRTAAAVKSDKDIHEDKVYIHIHIDNFVLVETA